jgi:hypothetical protein
MTFSDTNMHKLNFYCYDPKKENFVCSYSPNVQYLDSEDQPGNREAVERSGDPKEYCDDDFDKYICHNQNSTHISYPYHIINDCFIGSKETQDELKIQAR